MKNSEMSEFQSQFHTCSVTLRLRHGLRQFNQLDPGHFLLHKHPSSLIFLSHGQICIAEGDCFENSLTNACCTILFDWDRAYSNTPNDFFLSVKGIHISVKIKPSNIKHKISTCSKTYCQNKKKSEREFA